MEKASKIIYTSTKMLKELGEMASPRIGRIIDGHDIEDEEVTHSCKKLPKKTSVFYPTKLLGEHKVPRGAATASWTPQRRESMRAWMFKTRPWTSSTGPTSASGKAKVSMNGLRHGRRSASVHAAGGLTHALDQMTKALLDE